MKAPPAVVVKNFVPADLRRLLTLEAESFGADAWPRDLFRWYASTFAKLFLVAKVGARLAGYCVGAIARSRGEIDSIAVFEKYRRLKVGTILLRALIRILRRAGAESVSLMVRPANSAAIALYRKLGFVRRSTVADYYGKGSSGWRMTLKSGVRLR
ncbi:MAG: GNAT family N-acetyltransferase [Bryobacteraceae bacterium]|nr:GNAT family N-acetyltransferase [Bryobacteraceae bacterium]